jgi:hypothetical protein
MQPMRGVDTGKHRPIARELWYGFQYACSKLKSNFKEENKKIIIVLGSEKLLKYLENHQRIHKKY